MVPDLPQMAVVEMEATGDLPAWLAMEATVQLVTRRPPMAEPVEMAAIPAWLELGERADLEPGARMVSMGLLRHPAAMGATEVMVLALQHQANPVEMAALAEPVDLSATAAMGDSEAMEHPGRTESQVPMAQLAATAATAAAEEQEGLVE